MTEEKMRASELARELASRRRRVQGVCVVCGKPFEGTTKRRYCSPACQIRAYRKRQRAKAAAE